jgi:hypothetical protein
MIDNRVAVNLIKDAAEKLGKYFAEPSPLNYAIWQDAKARETNYIWFTR